MPATILLALSEECNPDASNIVMAHEGVHEEVLAQQRQRVAHVALPARFFVEPLESEEERSADSMVI